MAAEDDIVKVIMEKVREVNRTLTLDECVALIKKDIGGKTKGITIMKIYYKNLTGEIKKV